MFKKLLLVAFGVMIFFVVSPSAYAQEGTLTGTITDASKGDVLPGANVFIPKLNKGAASDVDGKFEISSLPMGTYRLTASFVGYKKFTTQVTIDKEMVMLDIELKPDYVGLDEVFVTAYGVQKTKNELSYSAQKVSGEELSKNRSSNFLTSLSGRVSGLHINQQNGMGGSTNIVLRGYGSITGNNQVLFIVDGVPYANQSTNTLNQTTGRGGYDYGNTATDINPDNIKSINVLKGPAAAALYGSRASNGAVVITTKDGGQRSSGIGITYNAGVDIGSVDESTLPHYQHLYGGGYGPFYSSPDGYFGYSDVNGDGEEDLIAPTTEDASFGARFDPNLMVYQWDAFVPESPNFGKARPWVAAEHDPNDFFQNSVNITNSITIEGGFDKGSYVLGYNQSNHTGILPNSKLDDHKLNLSATYDVTSKLTASASVNFVNNEGRGRFGTGYDAKNPMTSFRQWWQMNVDIENMKAAYFRNRRNNTWNWNSSLTGPIFWDNPYWDRYENFETDSRNRSFGHASLSFDIADWLNVMGRVSVDTYDQLQEERINVGSIDVSQYTRFNQSYSEYNYDLLFNYDKQLSQNFNLSGVFGANIRRQYRRSIRAQTNGGLGLPSLYSLANSANALQAPTEFDGTIGVNGYFASLNLDYNDLLILELTGRRDASSTLPKNENVYYYPSASLGFVFSELIGDNLEWLSYGKLRISAAQVGKTAPIYSVSDTYNAPASFENPAGPGNTRFGSVPLFSVNFQKKNPNLKPEQTKSWEVGLDVSFLKDRLSFDATYYKQNTLDQIIPAAISNATGYFAKFVNAGDVENRGVEITANIKPVVTNDLAWTVTTNWSKNVNKVKELAPGVQNLQLGAFQGGVSLNAALGEPYGTIRGSDFIYKDGKRVVGSDGFYERTGNSNVIIGDQNPDWLAGITNQVQYKNFSLNFLIDFRKGGDIFSLDQYYGQATGLYDNTAAINENGKNVRDPVSEGGGIILPGVKEDGTPNDVRASASSFLGAFGYVNNPNAAFVYDGSYIKLREVGLSYSLSNKVIQKIGVLSGAELSVVGRNLWIIHKNLPDADPEQNLSAGNLQGYQGGAYPSTRHFVFNLKLRF